MVKRILLLLGLIPTTSYGGLFWQNISDNDLKENLVFLAGQPVDKQIQIIASASPDFKAAVLKELYALSNEGDAFIYNVLSDPTSKNDFDTPLLSKLYDQSKEKGEFLNGILKRFSPEERQELINSLLDFVSYAELLQNISEEVCASVGVAANPVYFGALPQNLWLNLSYLPSFFDPTLLNALVNRDSHNEFDSFNQWGIWAQPFGFYLQSKQNQALKFNQYTAGISVGAEFVFFDRLAFGVGVVYSYSGIDWQPSQGAAAVNSLYFGPSLNYLFSNGFLGCTLIGAVNLNQIERSTNLFPDKTTAKKTVTNYTSWNLGGRLEGNLSLSPGGSLYFVPYFKVDYLTVFEPQTTEQLDDDVEMTINSLVESFLTSKVGLKLSWELFSSGMGFFIPYLSGGWINFTPLSISDYHFELAECSNLKNKVAINSWGQYYFGAGFAIVHKKAIEIALNYELTAGENSPVQRGDVRIELSW